MAWDVPNFGASEPRKGTIVDDSKNPSNGANNPSAEDGAKRLRLSVTRMKRIRSGIQAGGSTDHTSGGVTWFHAEQ